MKYKNTIPYLILQQGGSIKYTKTESQVEIPEIQGYKRQFSIQAPQGDIIEESKSPQIIYVQVPQQQQVQVEPQEEPTPVNTTKTSKKYTNKNEFISEMTEAYSKALKLRGINPDYASYLAIQDALESGFGKSYVGNWNYGNITVGSSGASYTEGKDHDGYGKQIINKFRNYDTLDDYINNKIDLLSGRRYRAFNGDISGFYSRVKAGGYAGDPNYVAHLNKLYGQYFPLKGRKGIKLPLIENSQVPKITDTLKNGDKTFTEMCAEFQNTVLRNSGYKTSNNAWNLDNADVYMSGYDTLEKPNNYSINKVQRYNYNAANNLKQNLDVNMLDRNQVYIANMYYNGSPFQKQAYDEGKDNITGTHTGYVKFNPDTNSWEVTHNIHGTVHVDSLNNVLGSRGRYGVTALLKPQKQTFKDKAINTLKYIGQKVYEQGPIEIKKQGGVLKFQNSGKLPFWSRLANQLQSAPSNGETTIAAHNADLNRQVEQARKEAKGKGQNPDRAEEEVYRRGLRTNGAIVGGAVLGALATTAPAVAETVKFATKTPVGKKALQKVMKDTAISMAGGTAVDALSDKMTGMSFGRYIAGAIPGARNLYDRSSLARFGIDMLNPGYLGLSGSKALIEGTQKSITNLAHKVDNATTIANARLTGKLKFGNPTTYTGIHQSNTPLTEVKFPFNRWDVTTHGADPNGFWLTLAETPNTEGTMASRPFASRWTATAQKPLIQTGEIENLFKSKNNLRNTIVNYGKRRGADAFEFRGIKDNALPTTDVVMVTDKTNPILIEQIPKKTINNQSMNAKSRSIDDIIDLARNGDADSIKLLEQYGIPSGEKGVYRFVDKGEIDHILSGKKYNGRFDDGRVDITSKSTGSSGASSNYRITFKDKFDLYKQDGRTRLKNGKLGDGWIMDGYTLDDIAVIEKLNPDGSYSIISHPRAIKGKEIKITPETAKSITDAEWDTAYNAAVESGNIAEAQRLRDLHFKIKAQNTANVDENGNLLKTYHGQMLSDKGYRDRYINPYSDKRTSNKSSGYFSTSSKPIAHTYNFTNDAPIFELYTSMKKPYIVDAQGKNWQNALGNQSTDKIFNQSISNGYDGIIIRNVDDVGIRSNTLNGASRIADDYVTTPGKAKLADAITYDDAGNIIPLSKRHDFTNPDIRYDLPRFAGKSVDTTNPTVRQTLVQKYSERYPQFQQTPEKEFVTSGDGYYEVGKIPFTEDLKLHKDLIRRRLDNFNSGWRSEYGYYTDPTTHMGNMYSGESILNKAGENGITVVVPKERSGQFGGFYNPSGSRAGESFTTADAWRSKPVRFTQLHESVSHPTDMFVRDIKSNVSGKSVRDLYNRVTQPSDLFPDFKNFFKHDASELWYEGRSTNNEMIKRINEIISKKTGKRLTEVYNNPELLETYVDTNLKTNEQLISFLESMDNGYLADYASLLKAKAGTKEANVYGNRIRNMIKTLFGISVPIAVASKQK